MRPTDILRAEHDHILRGCAVLRAMAETIEGGGKVPVEDATAIVDFVRFYADGLHHAKEEHVLFPAMEEAGMPRNGGPIAVMMMEHEHGRAHVAGMLQSLSSRPASFAEHARGFANLLEQHIAKENNILFKMAERILDRAFEVGLLEAYADREAEAGKVCGDKPSHESKLNEISRRWL